MTMKNLGSKYVGNDGTEDTNIMFVGEAPGADEVDEGLPFVGRSGQLLTEAIRYCGKTRMDVFLTNVCHYRPKGNKFSNVLGTEELKAGVEELKERIREINPTVIVACGAWPMYYLTGMTGTKGEPGVGIKSWRGSVLPCTLVEGPRVIPIYHPAYILRQAQHKAIFLHDIRRAFSQAEDPHDAPPWTGTSDPDLPVLRSVVNEVIENSIPISLDIETFRNGTFSCIGFATSPSIAYTVTYQAPHLHGEIRRLWESDVPKILQFGTYDAGFMSHFFGWTIGGQETGWDTFIAANNLNPCFPRGLDFLTSMYTLIPYYKEERKQWRDSEDINVLWEYNIKDVIATYRIAAAQMKEMGDLYGVHFELLDRMVES